MITKQDLKIKYGDDILLLFKGDEPFTEGENNTPLGVLIERDGKVVCNECGIWKKTLHIHLNKVHNMSAFEYKAKYGLNKSVGLCSKEISSTRSQFMIYRMKKEVSQFANKKIRELGYKKQKVFNTNTMQRKNGLNTCPEQIKMRINLLASKFGNNFSSTQAKTFDKKLVDYANRIYGGWNNMKKNFNFEITEVGKNNLKEEADLIYDLREYIKNFGTLPWRKDRFKKELRLNNFPHCKKTYQKRFGSMLKAYAKCGVIRESRQKCSVLN